MLIVFYVLAIPMGPLLLRSVCLTPTLLLITTGVQGDAGEGHGVREGRGTLVGPYHHQPQPDNPLHPPTAPHTQFEKKKAFRSRIAKLEEARGEPELVAALDELTKFVLEQKGLPLGIKKQVRPYVALGPFLQRSVQPYTDAPKYIHSYTAHDPPPPRRHRQDLITQIRKVKKAGKEAKAWNKDAEISYEQLVYSINYQQVRPMRPWCGLARLVCWALVKRQAATACNCN